jgi:hypothetical protein
MKVKGSAANGLVKQRNITSAKRNGVIGKIHAIGISMVGVKFAI